MAQRLARETHLLDVFMVNFVITRGEERTQATCSASRRFDLFDELLLRVRRSQQRIAEAALALPRPAVRRGRDDPSAIKRAWRWSAPASANPIGGRTGADLITTRRVRAPEPMLNWRRRFPTRRNCWSGEFP